MALLSGQTSTIDQLHPLDQDSPEFKQLKQQVRVHGSMQTALRKPSRTPDYSRNYVPGDPLNVLDWRSFAKNDQLIVRERRDEACAVVDIVVDLSESMDWPLPGHVPRVGRLPCRKVEVAIRLALHLASSHLAVGDVVHLWCGRGDSGTFSKSHYYKPSSLTDLIGVFSSLARERFSLHGVDGFFSGSFVESSTTDFTFVISDMLSCPDTILDIGHRNRGGCLLHTLSSLELSTEWMNPDDVYFDDHLASKEYTGRQLAHDDVLAKEIHSWSTQLQKQVENMGWKYVLLSDLTRIVVYQQLMQAVRSGG